MPDEEEDFEQELDEASASQEAWDGPASKEDLLGTKALLLRQVLAQKKAMLDHKRKNGLLYYRPTPKQELFHSFSLSKRRYVRTGNRWGKSTAGTAEDLAWLRGERAWLPEDHPNRRRGIPNRSVKGVLLVQDWDKAAEIFTNLMPGQQLGKLFKLMPHSWYAGKSKNHTGHVSSVSVKSIYGGVSTLYIDTVKSFLGNPQGHESSDWDFVHCDEPIPEAMWTAYARGLIDRGGFAWFLCTPTVEMWLNDMFFPSGQIRSQFDDGHEIAKESKWLITGSTYDNTHMSEEDIKQFKADTPAHEHAVRIEGRPKMLSGAIYTMYDPTVHLYQGTPFGWINHHTPPSNYTIRVAIDPHPSTPHAVLFAATSPFGTTYFYREIFQHCLTKQIAKLIMDALLGRKPAAIICDPLALIEHPNDGRSMMDDFNMSGLYPEPADKDLERGILNVQAKLDERDRYGRPVVQFSPSMHETVREFDRYVYDPKTGKPSKTCPDHMMENLYRLVNYGLEYIAPADQAQRKNYIALPSLSTGSARAAMRDLRQPRGPIQLPTRQRFEPRYGSFS